MQNLQKYLVKKLWKCQFFHRYFDQKISILKSFKILSVPYHRGRFCIRVLDNRRKELIDKIFIMWHFKISVDLLENFQGLSFQFKWFSATSQFDIRIHRESQSRVTTPKNHNLVDYPGLPGWGLHLDTEKSKIKGFLNWKIFKKFKNQWKF